jgi:mannose-6-phosphate isomerase-like protein (cupin superfamily)
MQLRSLSSLGLAALLAGTTIAGQSATHSSVTHITVASSSDIKWRPLRPGAEIAVVSGNPDAVGEPFVMRMRYTGNVRVPPHWHPTDEHLTVLSGTFVLGMGERFNESAATELAAGAYAFAPARMPHFAWSKGDTVVQVHGIGPFAINYVNAADRPATSPD